MVTELAGEGLDSLASCFTYSLAAGASIELLTTGWIANTTAVDLTGNELANQIWGNDGANVLNGGAGSDALIGFGGADTYAFTSALGGGNVDGVIGFVSGQDHVALDDAVFAGLGLGALAAGAFATGTAAAEADDRIVYNAATGALLFDADGTGATAAIQFAVLEPGTPLAANDFVVI
jgi:Ca2+-binding RTX toxin-like protein